MGKQIQSLERGLFILESILFSHGPVTSAEIAQRLGVHKSTVSHLTATLMEQGYLEKIPGSSRLTAGPKLFRVGRSVGLPAEAVEIARPPLAVLTEETGETSHIAELRGRKAFFLANSYPETALRVQTRTGSIEVAYASAVGKALLSGLPDDEIRAGVGGSIRCCMATCPTSRHPPGSAIRRSTPIHTPTVHSSMSLREKGCSYH